MLLLQRYTVCICMCVCGGGGGLFPVGPSIHTAEQSAEVIGVQSTMHGGENSE